MDIVVKIGVISIHPPLAGRDAVPLLVAVSVVISIHPPLAGRDFCDLMVQVIDCHFNPPAPCGAGPLTSNKELGVL